MLMNVSFSGFRAELAPHFSSYAILALWHKYKGTSSALSAESIGSNWAEYLSMNDFNMDGCIAPQDALIHLENGGVLCKALYVNVETI